ncbi:unnamed protein product [Ranitomeya imitator]|uniref:Calmodulin-binding transcription activator 1 n=1 Tax=Ranitomeya imitator TaxID=111125 RepID=A0ABN9M8D9_9NEOB|nr:unnamed protein product [Ranitomeya imitator]
MSRTVAKGEEQSQLGQNARLQCSPGAEASADNWLNQWQSEAINSQDTQKGATVISNANAELRRPRSEPSNYYSTENPKDYPAAKKHKLNPEYFQVRHEKVIATALSLEQSSIRKQSSGSKQPISESTHGEELRHFTRELPQRTPDTSGYRATAGLKWNQKELYLGQVTGTSKATGLGKDIVGHRQRQREQMSVLMMSEREMVDADLLSYRENIQNDDCLQHMDDLQVNMMNLAEQIIEATPDRIKRENFVPMESPLAERADTAAFSTTMSWLASYLADVDHLPSAAQIRSLYSEPLTPSSNTSLSPACSPMSETTFEKPSLPSAADWSEFLSASTNEKVENEFAQLTLSDHEQRELYEAAKLVQTVFRKYKGRPLREQQDVAAAVIQRCYRKYKQLTWIALKYALYKKMTQAAILIQSKFRSYYEQKKFQQSRRAAVLIQQYYRSYKECGRVRQKRRTASLVQQKLRSSLLTKKQDQAARKIMRFLRRCRHRIRGRLCPSLIGRGNLYDIIVAMATIMTSSSLCPLLIGRGLAASTNQTQDVYVLYDIIVAVPVADWSRPGGLDQSETRDFYVDAVLVSDWSRPDGLDQSESRDFQDRQTDRQTEKPLDNYIYR